MPPTHARHLFFVEGGTLAVENALKTAFDWKIRKNLARGLAEREGHADPPLPARVPRPVRLHALADEHRRPAQDAVLPEVRLAAPHLPDASRFPVTADVVSPTSTRRERPGRAGDPGGLRAIPGDDIAALILEPIQGEGGDNHFRPEFFARLRAARRRARVPAHLRRGADGRRHDRVDVGAGSSSASSPTCSASARRRRSAASPRTRGSTTSTTSSRSRRASTRPGAATSSTWSAAPGTSRSSRRRTSSRTPARRRAPPRPASASSRASFPAISNVRGRGLFVAFDLPDKETRDRTLAACLENGLIALASGASAIRFRPALTLSREEADEGVRKLRRARAGRHDRLTSLRVKTWGPGGPQGPPLKSVSGDPLRSPAQARFGGPAKVPRSRGNSGDPEGPPNRSSSSACRPS